MTPERRTHRVKRFLLWFVAPLDERLRGLSLVRVLAVGCFAIVYYDVIINARALSWVHFWILMAGLSAAFGKKVFLFLLSRWRGKTASEDQRIDARIDITQDITERREQGKEWGAEST